MDKFRIAFRCSKQPELNTGLLGFEPEKHYTGRAYNGLFEISTEWGRGRPTLVLDKKLFERYFELIKERGIEL